MYQIGDLIIYGSLGVCKVDSVGVPNIPGVDKSKSYYTLCPLYQNGKIYTPIDTSVFMRPVITYAEAEHLICLIPSIKGNVYNNKNQKSLEDHYQEFLQTHDCSNLFRVIKNVNTKKIITIDQGKKLGQIDERYKKKAEDLLYGEFAVALGIPKENVKSYIKDRVKELNINFKP